MLAGDPGLPKIAKIEKQNLCTAEARRRGEEPEFTDCAGRSFHFSSPSTFILRPQVNGPGGWVAVQFEISIRRLLDERLLPADVVVNRQ